MRWKSLISLLTCAALGLAAAGAAVRGQQGSGRSSQEPSPAKSARPTPSRLDRVGTLRREYDGAMEAWEKRFAGEDNAKVDWVARYRGWPAWSYLHRFQELAEAAQPPDEASIDAAFWIVERSRNVGPSDRDFYPILRRALELLARSGRFEDPRLIVMLRVDLRYPSPAAEAFLRVILDKTRDRALRGRASLSLANLLILRAELARKPLGKPPEGVPGSFAELVNQRTDLEVRRYRDGADVARLKAEGESMLEKIVADYAGVEDPAYPAQNGKKTLLGDEALSNLEELRTLAVGKEAPAIEGPDLKGKPLRLADYRGKVVVLSFWGSWCGPCIAEIPRERALVERHKGKPFALLGIDCDADKAAALKVVAENGITWPSWTDGAPGEGPIADRYKVSSYPRFFVLDGRGIIRAKHVRGDAIDKAVDDLLAEMAPDKPEKTR
jgi:thiol-disulfide isomerase/thioredoxin